MIYGCTCVHAWYVLHTHARARTLDTWPVYHPPNKRIYYTVGWVDFRNKNYWVLKKEARAPYVSPADSVLRYGQQKSLHLHGTAVAVKMIYSPTHHAHAQNFASTSVILLSNYIKLVSKVIICPYYTVIIRYKIINSIF